MKTIATAALIASSILSGLAHGTEEAAPAPAAVKPAHYPSDLVQGKVRLVLISVGQTTVFPNDNPAEPERNDHGAGVPCFTVTYLLERLGTEPYQKSVQGELKLVAAGKPLKWEDDRHSTYVKSFDYESAPTFLDFTKPKVSDPKRAIVVQHVQFGAAPSVSSCDLKITAGYDEDVQVFTFPGIRPAK